MSGGRQAAVNNTLKALNISFKKVVLPGRVKCGGTEEEIVVVNGRLPSPAPHISYRVSHET